MHPNNRLTINAIEAYPIDDFSPDVSSVDRMILSQCAAD